MAWQLETAVERWPIAGSFTISRGAKTEAVVVTATIREEEHLGRGECVPYARYGETIESVVDTIRSAKDLIADGTTSEQVAKHMPAGSARNALDCALIDLAAKRLGRNASEILEIGPLRPVETAYTISLATPVKMANAARAASDRSILKLKLGGDGDPERLAAIRQATPHARLVVDANEAWSRTNIDANMKACADNGVALIEQPLPAGDDNLLAEIERPIPICADESVHVAADVAGLIGRYDAVNIKLDKAGGLTGALALLFEAKKHGLKTMVGCMVGTSLAMAPAMLLAQHADFVDLDGPLLLSRDREDGLVYEGSRVNPPTPALWG